MKHLFVFLKKKNNNNEKCFIAQNMNGNFIFS